MKSEGKKKQSFFCFQKSERGFLFKKIIKGREKLKVRDTVLGHTFIKNFKKKVRDSETVGGKGKMVVFYCSSFSPGKIFC